MISLFATLGAIVTAGMAVAATLALGKAQRVERSLRSTAT